MHYYNALKETDYAIISLKEQIVKYVLISSLECKGSYRGIKSAIKKLLNVHISIGTIHNILDEAADRAKAFNENIVLDNIELGASDEIFQSGKPVLVGVEPQSTYVYLMISSDKRDSIAWSMAYYELQQTQSLNNLTVSVTDGGTGMKKGIKEVFEKIEEQYDVFHLEFKYAKALRNYESKAYKSINEEYKLKADHDKKNTKESAEKYEKACKETNEKINKYDHLMTMFSWLKELFSFGGYNYDDRVKLMDFIILEMEKLNVNNTYIKSAITTLKSNKKKLIAFVKRANRLILDLSERENIDINILIDFWNLKGFSEKSSKYKKLDESLRERLNDAYDTIKSKASITFKKVVRASSIVENINSQLRPYLFLKRTLKGKFLHLLQFYLNTRKYSHSRVNERIGKSPLELLTGKEHGDWLELLGY